MSVVITFVSLRSVIGLKKLYHPLNQSDTNLTPTVTWSLTLSRASRLSASQRSDAPSSQSIRCKLNTNRHLITHAFPRFATQCLTTNTTMTTTTNQTKRKQETVRDKRITVKPTNYIAQYSTSPSKFFHFHS